MEVTWHCIGFDFTNVAGSSGLAIFPSRPRNKKTPPAEQCSLDYESHRRRRVDQRFNSQTVVGNSVAAARTAPEVGRTAVLAAAHIAPAAARLRAAVGRTAVREGAQPRAADAQQLVRENAKAHGTAASQIERESLTGYEIPTGHQTLPPR